MFAVYSNHIHHLKIYIWVAWWYVASFFHFGGNLDVAVQNIMNILLHCIDCQIPHLHMFSLGIGMMS